MRRRMLQKAVAVLILLVLLVFGVEVYYSSDKMNLTVDVLHNWQQCSNIVKNLNQLKRLSGTADIDQIISNSTRLREICNNQQLQQLSRTRSSNGQSSSAASVSSSETSLFKTNYSSDSFTIIVPTYKRNYCVYAGLRHYCQMKHVDMIIVLWNNIGEEIPRYLNKLRCKPKLKFIKMKENRMTTRYILRPEIKTEGM